MLRKIPIRRSGTRDNLFMGGDRELVMFSGLIAITLIFNAMTLLSTLLALVVWFAALYVFRLMAKADPKMRWIYLRHIKYRKYYPPRSTPFRKNLSGHGSGYR